MSLFKKSLNRSEYIFDLTWPYQPKIQEGYAEESFTFRQIYLQYVQLMAQGWFDTEEIKVREAFAGSDDVNAEDLVPAKPDGEVQLFDEIGVQKNLLHTQKRFVNAERVSWDKSPLGHRWLSKLTELGVNLFPMPSPQDPSIQVVSGPWKLFDNETPFPLFGEVWRDKSTGAEFIYWFFDALARNRSAHPTKGIHPSHAFFIPAMFQRIGYLSETIFPSSMVRMRDRLGEFGTDNPKHVPSLAFHVEKDYSILTLVDEGKHLAQRFDWSPEVTRYGYIIDDSIPFTENPEIIPKVVDALPKAASVIMDGYCNWTDGQEINFQNELFLDYDLKGVQLEEYELGFFIAGSAYGRLSWKGIMKYAALDSLEKDTKLLLKDSSVPKLLNDGYWSLINRGCGTISMHSINTFYFRVGKKRREEIAAFGEVDKQFPRRALRYMATYAVENQDANALSNLAVYELNWRDYERAITTAEEGLAKLKKSLPPTPSDLWQDNDASRLPIRLELLLTQARSYVGLGKKTEAKRLLEQIDQEAKAFDFKGWEYTEAMDLLATL
ncbi:MAG: hypothetical protein ACKN9N_07050 [Actinomycetota bacterium]